MRHRTGGSASSRYNRDDAGSGGALHLARIDLPERGRLRPAQQQRFYKASFRSRSALPITDTELRLIAALAIIGLSRMPKNG